MLTGAAAYYVLPWGWSWDLCMVFGSILAATDPVAVVTMLKELGASPKLTMQITGEALMNDGTAMVLFNLFWAIYNNNRGYLYRDPFQIMKFFVVSLPPPLQVLRRRCNLPPRVVVRKRRRRTPAPVAACMRVRA